jgi:hypothetical protein
MNTTIEQLQKQLGYIPYTFQMQKELVCSPEEAENTIKKYIHTAASSEKTKGTQLFQRFYENEADLFWQFRALNEDKNNIKNHEFHRIWEKVQAKLWNLEHILTDKMIKRDTDRTVTAFYDHARLFFPLLDSVGIEE